MLASGEISRENVTTCEIDSRAPLAQHIKPITRNSQVSTVSRAMLFEISAGQVSKPKQPFRKPLGSDHRHQQFMQHIPGPTPIQSCGLQQVFTKHASQNVCRVGNKFDC